MTSLHLAERVAEAAQHPRPGQTPAQAVLEALRAESCWFCRWDAVPGVTTLTTIPTFEYEPPWPFA